MQLIELRLKNIHALQGEHVLRFNEPPLADCGLFLIAGDTGSGKSSILDALSLGLFGKIPRDTKYKDIITHSENEAYALVRFKMGDTIYESSWHVKPKKRIEGSFKDPDRTLAKVTSEGLITITDKKSEHDKELTAIIGMNYNQFRRSVLLAQSDFAGFLYADTEKKISILELLTTDIYRKISEAVYQRHKEVKEELKSIQQRLDDLQLLDPETLVQHQTEKQALETESKTLKEKVKELKTIENLYGQLKETQKVADQLRLEQEKFDEKLSTATHSFALREQLKMVQPLEVLYSNILNIDKQRQKCVENRDLLEKELISLTAEEKNYQLLYEQAELSKKAASENLAGAMPLFEEAQKLETVKTEKEKDLVKLQGDISKLDNEIPQLKLQLEKLDLELAQLDQEYTADNHKLTQYKSIEEVIPLWDSLTEQRRILGDLYRSMLNQKGEYEKATTDYHEAQNNVAQTQKTIEKLIADQTQIQIQLHQLVPKSYLQTGLSVPQVAESISEQHRLAQHRLQQVIQSAAIVARYRELSSQIIEFEDALEDSLNYLSNLFRELTELETALSELQHEADGFEQKLKIEAIRQQLRDHTPCPVCGSVDHPYRHDLLFDENTEQQLTDNKNKIAACKSRIRVLRSHIDILPTPDAINTDDRVSVSADIRSKLAAIEAELARCTQEATFEWPTSFREVIWSELKSKLQSEVDELEKLAKQIQGISRNWQECTQLITQSEMLLQERLLQLSKAEYQVKNSNKLYEEARRKFDTDKERFDVMLQPVGLRFEIQGTFKSAFENLAIKIKEYTDITRRIGDNRLRHGQLHHQRQINEVKLHNLEKERTAKTVIGAEMQSIIERQNEELQKLFNGEYWGDVKNALLRATESTNQAAQDALEKLNEIRNKVIKSETELKTLKQQITELDDSYHTHQAKFDFEAQQRSFQNRQDCLRLLAQLEELPELDRLYQALEEERITLTTRAQENEKRLDDLAKLLKDTPPADVIRRECLDLESKLHTHYRRIGELEAILKQHTLLNEQNERLLKEKSVLAEKERIASLLNDLIGSADGKKFNAFAQSLTLDRLLVLTNNHLRHMTDRYTLRRHGEYSALDIVVQDDYFGGNERPVQSLSGGETFIASLALSLGLADMMTDLKGSNMMFIDEGFGSLDQSSLDAAISVLEQLRSSGKTIGIISHVSELRQRISMQVMVEKTGFQGYSRIVVVG